MCKYESTLWIKSCGDISKILSRGLKVEGNVFDIIETFMKYQNDQLKPILKNMKIKLTIIEK